MDFSDFGKRFAGEIGIGELMDDLGTPWLRILLL